MTPESTSSKLPEVVSVKRPTPRSPRRRYASAVEYVAGYLLVITLPIAALLLGPVPGGGGFWWDFAMGLGFGGLAMLGAQFALTARFHRLTAPFGIDIIYYFHRWAAIGAVGLVLAHYLILRLAYPLAVGTANPLRASFPLTAGRVALLLFVTLIVTSLARKRLKLSYDHWRLGHGMMASTAMVLAVVHIAGTGNYTRVAWKGDLWIGYVALWVGVLGYIRLVRPLRLRRRPYRVVRVTPQGGSAWELTLRPEGNGRLPFSPGQFAWLSLGQSPFRAEEHPFSFSGSAESPGELQFTIKALGDFTRTVGRTQIGEVAYVDGPYGVFTPDLYPHSDGFVFIAGGVGIAPIISMLRTLAERADPRPLHLIYGNWNCDEILFREEFDRLALKLSLQITHVLQAPPPRWPGPTGFITEAVLAAALPLSALNYHFFLCGPRAMTDFVTPSLRHLGVSSKRIHFEHFEMA